MIIVLLFTGAFLLRVYGIKFNLGQFFHQDESHIVEIARNIVKTWDFNPHYFRTPTAYIYLQALVFNFIFLVGFIIGTFFSLDTLSNAFFVFGGRILSAFLGSLNVIIVYALGNKVFNKKVGVIASIFLGVLLVHVQNSQLISADIPLTLFITLVIYFSTSILLRGNLSKKNTSAYFFAGFFIALATGTRYIGILSLIPFLTAHFLRKTGRFGIQLPLGLITAGIVFFATSPYLLIEFSDAIAGLREEFQFFQSNANVHASGNTLLFYANYLFRDGLGFLIFPLSIIGIFTAFRTKKGRKPSIVMLSFIIPYALFVSIFFQSVDRVLLPVLPILCIFAAIPITDTVQYIMKQRAQRSSEKRILAFITILLIAYPLYQVIRHDSELSNASKAMQAEEQQK